MCIDVMILSASRFSINRINHDRVTTAKNSPVGYAKRVNVATATIHIAIDPEQLLCFHDNEPPSINHTSVSIVSA